MNLKHIITCWGWLGFNLVAFIIYVWVFTVTWCRLFALSLTRGGRESRHPLHEAQKVFVSTPGTLLLSLDAKRHPVEHN